jgi:hypothetical protein
VSGIAIMLLLVATKAATNLSNALFYTSHPLHVVLSALVTTAMYRRHRTGGLWAGVLIGYSGSVGVATLSDAVMPFLGARLLGVGMPLHLPFIEGEKMAYVGVPVWILVNAAAAIGIALGLLRPKTKLPHASHVLVSTWASLFALTAFSPAGTNWLPLIPFVFVILVVAVWVPCCTSDIVYPLLWIRSGNGTPPACSHDH